MRSKWKNFISRNYRSPAYYFSRSYFFKVEDIGKRIRLHIGRKFREFPIKKSMVGHFAGEFIYCKKLGSSIHIVKKKLNKNFKKNGSNCKYKCVSSRVCSAMAHQFVKIVWS